MEFLGLGVRPEFSPVLLYGQILSIYFTFYDFPDDSGPMLKFQSDTKNLNLRLLIRKVIALIPLW